MKKKKEDSIQDFVNKHVFKDGKLNPDLHFMDVIATIQHSPGEKCKEKHFTVIVEPSRYKIYLVERLHEIGLTDDDEDEMPSRFYKMGVRGIKKEF